MLGRAGRGGGRQWRGRGEGEGDMQMQMQMSSRGSGRLGRVRRRRWAREVCLKDTKGKTRARSSREQGLQTTVPRPTTRRLEIHHIIASLILPSNIVRERAWNNSPRTFNCVLRSVQCDDSQTARMWEEMSEPGKRWLALVGVGCLDRAHFHPPCHAWDAR